MTKRRDQFEPPLGYASAPEKNPKKYKIRVGDKVFPMSRWREGILYFLFSVWSGDPRFLKNPEIRFGGLTLILDPDNEKYSAEGEGPDEECTGYFGNYSLDVSALQAEVQDALVRFTKDPYLGRITLRLPNCVTLDFWQKERRGEYGCSVHYG